MPSPDLRPGRFGLEVQVPYGERGCLALPAPPQLHELLAQRFINESPLPHVPLEPGSMLSETDY